ncbi:hypothetical protein J4H86_25845 [Spiractinospora alimapuensis]|uniref:hypothetical protein n=1 Tax=Spiractinospora alimapuensis TaxID=2820884 RepID=UPI001F198046|nr:hypothetical protein [Spiractinospora alimapuensis]QVQ52094.1 hypothetical protein J4H86_25845 [Spiractinospora alimapuensis]
MSSLHASAAASPTRRVLHQGSIGMFLGGGLLSLGAFLPWVLTPLGNHSGMGGPGLWVLCAGVIAIAGGLLPYRTLALVHALVPAAVSGILVGWQCVHLIQLSAATDSWGKALPGIGMVLVAGGVVLLLRAARRIRTAT